MVVTSEYHEAVDRRQVPVGTRRDRALVTRQRVIDAAHRSFRDRGYQATTMAGIAKEARVATQTAYYVFGTKARLFEEVIEAVAAARHGGVPVMDRPWAVEAINARNPSRSLALVVEHGVDIYARVAPLRDAILAAAATEPAIAASWQAIAQRRRAAHREIIDAIGDLGALRTGLERAAAADILSVMNSHETYLGLVRDSAWTERRYKAWLYRMLRTELLTPEHAAGAPPTEDLSFHVPP